MAMSEAIIMPEAVIFMLLISMVPVVFWDTNEKLIVCLERVDQEGVTAGGCDGKFSAQGLILCAHRTG